MPQPFSPFRWTNYVETKDKVYQGFVDLLRKEDSPTVVRQGESISGASLFEKIRELDKLYQPPGKVRYRFWQKLDGSSWVEKALTTEGVKFYYWFARFPVVKSVNSNNGTHRVEFMDVRFLMPGVRLPFVYYVEFDSLGKIQSEGFAGSTK
jgi:hypothetical protein